MKSASHGLEIAAKIGPFLVMHGLGDRLCALICLARVKEPAHPANMELRVAGAAVLGS